ncbi:MAG: ABC transporter ATP-binding protein [Bacillota bacterium]|nr:ABC transporter ATP-binding protein [Bacillota bacterium]
MIKVNNLTKSFDDFTALNNLSLHVDKGAIYGLIGINGSGKTTLIRHLTGVLMPDNGEVLIGGERVLNNAACKERMGYIPDELFFYPGYSIKQMAKYYKGLYPTWSDDRYHEMVAAFGLNENSKIAKFSKGMQKQAAFILVMSTRPEVLILDEPIDGLDPIMRKKVWGYVLGDVADHQMTVLISSHNLRELEGICDSVGILSQGCLKFEGKLEDLKNEAKDMSLEELFFYEMGGEI